VRHQIDRAVGQALVDPSFAARLLVKPGLALDIEACSQEQCLAVCQIRAFDLESFARQMFAQFWGPAASSVGRPSATRFVDCVTGKALRFVS